MDFLNDVDDENLYVPLDVQRERARQEADERIQKRRLGASAGGATALGAKRGREPNDDSGAGTGGADGLEPPAKRQSLLEMNLQRLEEQRKMGVSEVDAVENAVKERRKEEEAAVEQSILHGGQLKSAYDLAHGVSYGKRLASTWEPPGYIRRMSEEQVAFIRKKYNVLIEGDDVPRPCLSFSDFKIPHQLTAALDFNGILTPKPIQMQGIPACLSNRDVIGVAYTGSGKTLVFVIPMLVKNMDEERMMPLTRGEGPLSLALAPSRELAMQHFDIYVQYAEALYQRGLPLLRAFPAIGGASRAQGDAALRNGMHACFATPGRLMDCLKRNTFNFNLCSFVCLDEADRMVDMGFEEDVRDIYQHFKQQRQTVMFSATMPKKIIEFARTSLVDPVVVNVNRAGAASLDIRQEVEYVEKDMKLINLLECLQKTPPPVLIFAEQKPDVDYIHEYLLLKCVETVSIHGGKDQTERTDAISRFRHGRADVLVATDIASKGLDFPDIQHVINFDLPREIENYVHRIGRTGRNGKVGLATTFINASCPLTTLMDLKHLLREAKQRVPPVLEGLPDPTVDEEGERTPCAVCGGLGHTTYNCPKLQQQSKQQRTDFGGGGEM